MKEFKSPMYWKVIILGAIINYFVPEYFLTNYLIGFVVGISVCIISNEANK